MRKDFRQRNLAHYEIYAKKTLYNRNSIMLRNVSAFICLIFLCTGNMTATEKKQAPPVWLNVKSWVYQLCDYKNNKLDQLCDADYDLAVIDLSRDGCDDYFTKDEIEKLKRSGKIVLAYFEIGAIEDYRPEWKSVPNDLKVGAVDGWPKEQYVKFWDKRWWPVVKGRIDQALEAGFNGAYLDMITTYEEINSKMSSEERAQKMVSLIAKISKYAKNINPEFKIVAQNAPELYTWSPWNAKKNLEYINAIDGLALESVFYIAHDKPAKKKWCQENRKNALEIKKAGKLLLGVDYAKKEKTIKDAYKKQRQAGFVPYVTTVNLDHIMPEPK